jgi:hypothetical protein
MATPSWDARAQFDALLARKRHEERNLALTGSLLAVVSAILLVELLAMNEDSNTFLVVCVLNLGMLLGWIGFARRVGLAGRRWTGKARGLEKEVLRIPSLYSLWEESGERATPAWIAVGWVLAAMTAFWFGLLAYVVWVTYLVR